MSGNTGSGRIDVFDIKVTFEMLTARGQQHSFSTHERMFLWKYQSFWDRKCLDLRGGLEPSIFGFVPNALIIWVIRARHLLSHVCEYWFWRYRYFLSKVNIWNVDCARATAFIFDTRTMLLWKCQRFWNRKCLDLRGTRTPNLRIYAECSNHLSYQGQLFAALVCEYWLCYGVWNGW